MQFYYICILYMRTIYALYTGYSVTKCGFVERNILYDKINRKSRVTKLRFLNFKYLDNSYRRY